MQLRLVRDKTINLIDKQYIMSNKKELHRLTKELVKQMMNRDVDDVQDADYQIAYCYLAKALTLCGVSQQRELLVWLEKSDLVTFPKDEIKEVIDDYRFYQTNCG